MREAFQRELAEIERRLLDGLAGAASTLTRLAPALADPSLLASSSVESSGALLRETTLTASHQLFVVGARQAPVAGDLRWLMAMLEITDHAARIANQLDLIAEQLHEINPEQRYRTTINDQLSSMASLASELLTKACAAFAERDETAAGALAHEDDAIDRLNREIFRIAADEGGTPAARETAMRQILMARSLERLGDNAVDIAEFAAFLVTGELTELSQA
ncbi:MAG: hypothetical protein DLM63_10990 [Solirubrobacterales bacterium]|nr:MAG: hypothetical protein DLM63_10990 [Solirubrobacterales bacterium]